MVCIILKIKYRKHKTNEFVRQTVNDMAEQVPKYKKYRKGSYRGKDVSPDTTATRRSCCKSHEEDLERCGQKTSSKTRHTRSTQLETGPHGEQSWLKHRFVLPDHRLGKRLMMMMMMMVMMMVMYNLNDCLNHDCFI